MSTPLAPLSAEERACLRASIVADRDLAVAQEQVRSLTVERDALVVSRDECFDRATREAKAADEARARLSRARERQRKSRGAR